MKCKGLPGDRVKLAPTKTFILSCDKKTGRRSFFLRTCQLSYDHMFFLEAVSGMTMSADFDFHPVWSKFWLRRLQDIDCENFGIHLVRTWGTSRRGEGLSTVPPQTIQPPVCNRHLTSVGLGDGWFRSTEKPWAGIFPYSEWVVSFHNLKRSILRV